MKLNRNRWSFSRNFLMFNVFAFIFVKFLLPSGTLHLARLIDALPAYDSREIVTLTNEARKAGGRNPLSISHKLDLAAQEKLNHMALEEYFAHISPSGTTPWYWIKEADYKYAFAGENLAIGFLKADETVDAWMESSSHRANILNSNYTEIGVAVSTVEINGSQGILVVQMFGKPTTLAVNIPSVESSETLQTVVNDAEPENIKESAVSLQYVSTDSDIPAVDTPTAVRFQEQNGPLGSDFDPNSIYVLYTLIIAVISVVMATMIHGTRGNLIRAAVHVGLFVASVSVPVINLSVNASIF